jgi:transposase-like protein
MKNEHLAESLKPLEANTIFASSLKWTEVIDRDGEFQMRGLRSYFQFSGFMLRSPNEASWLITK